MLYAFILGIGLMVGLALLIPWLTQVEPRKIAVALRWLAAVLLGLVFAGLLITGRLVWAVTALAAMAPILLSLRRLARTFGPGGDPFRGMGGGGGAGTSEVTSRYLHMRLDTASGALDGAVIAGRFAGRELSSLARDEVLDLRAEVAEDADSLRLLEVWLDRVHADWRTAAGDGGTGDGAGGARGTAAGPMDRTEALRVLGLEEGAGAEAVQDAYRRLMARAHPDHGGSAWMAAKLNEARDILLDAADR